MLELLTQLRISEDAVSLFTNRRKEPLWLNRVKKFFAHPIKYIYENSIKIGIVSNSDNHIKMFWGGKMFVPLSDKNAELLYYCGTQRYNNLAHFLIKRIAPKDVFYDVGAHFGFYTALVNQLGAEVHSFEPNPRALRYLRANAGPAHINSIAIADTQGTMHFTDISDGGKSSLSTLFPDVLINENKRCTITVKTDTLDNYIKHISGNKKWRKKNGAKANRKGRFASLFSGILII